MLFLSHRLPYAPNRGDRMRAYFLLRSLRSVAEVDVLSLTHDAEEASHVADMSSLVSSTTTVSVPRTRNLARGVVTLPSRVPLTHTLLDAPALQSTLASLVESRRPDVVVAYCSGMARLALRAPLSETPFVLDMVDVDSAKWSALASVASRPMRWIYGREARVLRVFEARASIEAHATTVVTQQEADTLKSIVPTANIHVVPNGVDVDALAPANGPGVSKSVVFCGVMNYAPNVEAARLLALEVWPAVRQQHPDATLTLVGSEPTRAVQALASAATGVVVTGAVPDVRPYLWSAAIAAAPIVTARGIQNKVLEAVAAGLPTVVTPNIMQTLPPALTGACVSAGTAADLAAAVVALLAKSPEERRAIALTADTQSLRWEQQLQPFGRLVEDAYRTGRSRLDT